MRTKRSILPGMRISAFIGLPSELRDRFIDEDERCGGAAAIRTALGDPFAHLRLNAGHPDHKKFIKVIGRNRQKPHPLEHGMPGIDRFLKHPAIEMQPGQLAVDEPFGARGDRRGNFEIGFFFFYFNSLYGFHQVSIHLGARKHHHPTNATQSMCYRNDVSMTLTFRQAAPLRPGLPNNQSLRSSSAASARVTGRPSRSASLSRSSTIWRTAA